MVQIKEDILQVQRRSKGFLHIAILVNDYLNGYRMIWVINDNTKKNVHEYVNVK